MAEDEGSRQGGGVSGEEKEAVIDNMGEFGLDPKAGLLPFQQDMFKDIMADVDALLVTGQGMGLHRLLVSMLRVHCDPKSLVLVINANVTTVELATEELSLSTSFPPKILSMDQLSTDRRDIYLEGGVVFVTSRILVVDMLMGRVPMANVHGIVVPDAHRVIPTSSEAFILRLFRHENRTGFIKAITDSAQGLVGGFNLLEKVMRSLWVSQLYLWPRFEKRVIDTLSTRQPEVFEVKVDMTSMMQLIQLAISDLMVSCLKQLRKLRPSLEMEFLTVERGLFPAFDQALRRQLDPVWHTLGFRTKQLVKELKTLRTMAKYLDQYDPVSFYFYLETLRVGEAAVSSSCHWLMLDAADDLYMHARRRVFPPKAAAPGKGQRGAGRGGDGGDGGSKRGDVGGQGDDVGVKGKKGGASGSEEGTGRRATRRATRRASRRQQQKDDDESSGEDKGASRKRAKTTAANAADDDDGDGDDDGDDDDDDDVVVVVEDDDDGDNSDDDDGDGDGEASERNADGIELAPKWNALIQLLDEIEDTAERPLLICVRDKPTATQVAAVLERGQDAVLQYHLHRYRRWKASVSALSERGVFGGQSVVHRRLGRRAARVARRRERAAQEAKAKRQQRQRRGGGGDRDGDGGDDDDDEQEEFETTIPELVDLGTNIIEEADQQDDSQRGDGQQSDMAVPPDEEFRRHYRVLQPDDLMFILPFYLPEVGVSTARFARILNDVKPKTIVFYDPHLACAREVELYQSAHPELDLHVYFMMYRTSFQEQQYLSSIRHEKEAFERIITAKRTMALPADQDGRRGIRQAEERQLKTRLVASRSSSVVGASTRRGGGRALAEGAPRPKVIVDMREFRSSLPSLIHEFGMDVVPVTLIVGDYVLSPDICVERKSLPDLIGSLSSGRLYSQVLAMTTYYARPALLIEFDESKPFSLLGSGETLSDDIEFKNTMSKLTLLTLTFPSLRVLWSRSPHATAELFYTLKQHQHEPDATAAANVGEEGTHNEEDYALEPMVVLKTVPGVTPHNAYAIMEKVKNLEELTQLGLKQLQEVAGKANGRLMYDFFNNTTTVDDDDKGHDDKKG